MACSDILILKSVVRSFREWVQLGRVPGRPLQRLLVCNPLTAAPANLINSEQRSWAAGETGPEADLMQRLTAEVGGGGGSLEGVRKREGEGGGGGKGGGQAPGRVHLC